MYLLENRLKHLFQIILDGLGKKCFLLKSLRLTHENRNPILLNGLNLFSDRNDIVYMLKK